MCLCMCVRSHSLGQLFLLFVCHHDRKGIVHELNEQDDDNDEDDEEEARKRETKREKKIKEKY